jgi:(p)ppGpp synthase/HD superfamily hydrolase
MKKIDWTKIESHCERIARIAHIGNYSSDGLPKICHMKAVATGVEGPFLKSIAWLHDVLEDCSDWTASRLLQEGVPESVVEVVSILTHNKESESYDEYMKRVILNPTAVYVKLSDLRHNMDISRIKRPLTEKEWERTRKYHSYYVLLQKVYLSIAENIF